MYESMSRVQMLVKAMSLLKTANKMNWAMYASMVIYLGAVQVQGYILFNHEISHVVDEKPSRGHINYFLAQYCTLL